MAVLKILNRKPKSKESLVSARDESYFAKLKENERISKREFPDSTVSTNETACETTPGFDNRSEKLGIEISKEDKTQLLDKLDEPLNH